MAQHLQFRPLPPLLICANLQRDEAACDLPGRCDDALAACQALLARWRAQRFPVLHLKRIAQDAWFDASRSDFLDSFRPTPGELSFEHALPSAYSSARFAEYMRSVRPEASVFVGLSLDQTILCSAIDGFHRGHRHQVVGDAVDTVRHPPAARDTLLAVLGAFSSTFDASGLLAPGRRAA
jgi:nicotinamidase-related amidase